MLQEGQLNINSTETTLLYQIREELRENNRLLNLLIDPNPIITNIEKPRGNRNAEPRKRAQRVSGNNK